MARNRLVEHALERLEGRILVVRGVKVLLDADLAALYSVETRALNQAVKRNASRFPADFMFQLSPGEFSEWRSQAVISNPRARMALRRAPFAFSEHGALMAATVLNSQRAVETSLFVVRTFVRLREFLASHVDIARKLQRHERELSSHDQAIAGLVDTIRQLMAPSEPPKRRHIGFVNPEGRKRG